MERFDLDVLERKKQKLATLRPLTSGETARLREQLFFPNELPKSAQKQKINFKYR